MGLQALRRQSITVKESWAPSPLLQPSLWELCLDPSQASCSTAHGQRAGGVPLTLGSPAEQRTEVSLNAPVFSGAVTQSKSAPAAQEVLCY